MTLAVPLTGLFACSRSDAIAVLSFAESVCLVLRALRYVPAVLRAVRDTANNGAASPETAARSPGK